MAATQSLWFWGSHVSRGRWGSHVELEAIESDPADKAVARNPSPCELNFLLGLGLSKVTFLSNLDLDK